MYMQMLCKRFYRSFFALQLPSNRYVWHSRMFLLELSACLLPWKGLGYTNIQLAVGMSVLILFLSHRMLLALPGLEFFSCILVHISFPYVFVIFFQYSGFFFPQWVVNL